MDKVFKCCGSREFKNYCCIQCLNIFHPSCLERTSGWIVIGGYKIYCSSECQERHIDEESSKQRLNSEIDRLENVLTQKDTTMARLKRRTKDFEDDVFENDDQNNLLIREQDAKIKGLDSELRVKKSKVEALQSELQNLGADLIRISGENKELRALKLDMLQTAKGLKSENCILNEENTELRLQLETCKRSKSNIEAQTQLNPNELFVKKEELAILVDAKFNMLEGEIKRLGELLVRGGTTIPRSGSEVTLCSNSTQPPQTGCNQEIVGKKLTPSKNKKKKSTVSKDKDDGKQLNHKSKITLSQVSRAVSYACTTANNRESQSQSNTSSNGVALGLVTSGSATNFRGVPQKFWYYIGRVADDVTTECVSKYITDKINVPHVELIVKQLKAGGRLSSFKIGIDEAFRDHLLKEDFWPDNVIHRKFDFYQGAEQEAGNQKRNFYVRRDNFNRR